MPDPVCVLAAQFFLMGATASEQLQMLDVIICLPSPLFGFNDRQLHRIQDSLNLHFHTHFSSNTHIHTSLHPASYTNRRMLCTKFIIPIFTPTPPCSMLRTSRLACWENTCSTRARTLDRFRFASCSRSFEGRLRVDLR